MKIQDLKITSEDYVSKDIVGLPDRPSEAGMSAQALKERFDASTKHIVQPKFNQLIEILTSTEGADNIGITPIEGVAGYTVQQILLAIKLLLDDKKNAEQSDREIAQKFDTSEAQALVKEVTFSEGSGVFTITKYDGSVQTYDTALEKVALDVRLDGQQFVLTLVDGTEQRVDLSAFLTQTEVNSSDTITLSIESGAIVARLATGSIQKMHLSDALIEYIEGKEGLAAESAAAAKVSEQNALNSANAAKASEQAAKTCQEQACLCATQADSNRQAAEEAQDAAEKAAKEAQAIAGLPNGKVPVQNGGWYVDENTTEEDKAEAKAALEELGLDADVDLSAYLPKAEVGGVHNIRTYTSIARLGLSAFSNTDYLANFVQFMEAMPSRSIFMEQFASSNNFVKALMIKLKEDANFNISCYYEVKLEKLSANVMTISVIPVYASTAMYYKREYCCVLRYSSDGYRVLTPFTLVRGRERIYKATYAPTSETTFFLDGDIWLQYE